MADKNCREIEILLVEDNPGDVELTVDALSRAKISNHVSVVQDGLEALAFLKREGKYKDAPRPDLIFLDWNLPGKHGRDVLAEVKQTEELRRIPVCVLTTSDSEQDVIKAYSLHANCYITKPVDIDQFIALVKSIEDFWFKVVKFPSE